MVKPQSVKSLEKLGKVRLSQSFYMRDFLYSEVSNFYGRPNIPDNPDLAITAAKHLCKELLEPINATFGRVSIMSGYRSPTLNKICNVKRLGCANNQSNYARHIFDYSDKENRLGATASILIPWFTDRYAAGADWQSLAWWIHDNLPYCSLCFFPKLAIFNIGWSDKPRKTIHSYIPPKGCLTKPGMENHEGHHSNLYQELPKCIKK